MTTEKRKRIGWTKAENEAVAHAIIQRFGTKSAQSLQRMTVAVQADVLPLERQRNHLSTAASVAGLRKVYEPMIKASQWVKNEPESKGPTPAPGTAKVKKVAPIESTAIDDLPFREAPTYLPETTPDLRRLLVGAAGTFLSDIIVDAIQKTLTRAEIANVLHSIQMGTLPSLVVEQTAPRPKHDPAPAACDGSSTPADSKPVVLVCGFKPHQQVQFQPEHPALRLRFWYADQPAQGLEVLRQKAGTADAVVFSMEATSHGAVRMAETACRRIVRVTGGATSMHEALRRLTAELVPQGAAA